MLQPPRHPLYESCYQKTKINVVPMGFKHLDVDTLSIEILLRDVLTAQ